MNEKDKMYTLEEARVILEAERQGKEYLDMTIITTDGSWIAPFCGSCGRIVHHPNCSKVIWTSGESNV